MFIFILISALIVSGCSLFGKKFDNDEVIAEVRGTEITYGDIRFLYEDDDIKDGVTIAINIELARQGVEELRSEERRVGKSVDRGRGGRQRREQQQR